MTKVKIVKTRYYKDRKYKQDVKMLKDVTSTVICLGTIAAFGYIMYISYPKKISDNALPVVHATVTLEDDYFPPDYQSDDKVDFGYSKEERELMTALINDVLKGKK